VEEYIQNRCKYGNTRGEQCENILIKYGNQERILFKIILRTISPNTNSS